MERCFVSKPWRFFNGCYSMRNIICVTRRSTIDGTICHLNFHWNKVRVVRAHSIQTANDNMLVVSLLLFRRKIVFVILNHLKWSLAFYLLSQCQYTEFHWNISFKQLSIINFNRTFCSFFLLFVEIFIATKDDEEEKKQHRRQRQQQYSSLFFFDR